MISLTFIGPVMASSKGGGSVTQEKVSTGDPSLDKQINKFYSCISKTHQDPPTIEKIDSCYYQGVGGSGGTSSADIGIGIGGEASSTPPSTSISSHHKHGNTEGSSDISSGTGSGDTSAPLPVSSGHHHKH